MNKVTKAPWAVPALLIGAAALWVLIVALFPFPLVLLDARLQQPLWKFPHTVRLPVTIGFVALALWQWWYPDKAGKSRLTSRAFFLLLVLTIVCCRWHTLGGYEHNPDESESILAARKLLIDSRFWVSVDAGTHGPLVSFWQTLLPRFGFAVDYASSRLLGIGMGIVAVAASFAVLRRVASEAVARLVLVPLVFVIAALDLPDFTAYNGEHPIFLLCMLSLACVASALVAAVPDGHKTLLAANDADPTPFVSSSGSRSLLFAGGLLAGCIGWAKNQGLPIEAALIVVSAVGCWILTKGTDQKAIQSNRIKSLCWYGIGLILPTLVILLWVARNGALPQMMQSYFAWNVAYANRFQDANQAATFLKTAKWAMKELFHLSRYSAAFAVGIIAGWGLFFWRFFSRRVPLPLSTVFLMSATAVVGLAAWFSVIKPGNGFSHYLLLAVFPAFLLPLMAWATLLDPSAKAESTNRRRLGKNVWLDIVFVTLGVFFPLIPWGFLGGGAGGGRQLVVPFNQTSFVCEDVVAAIDAIAKPDERVSLWAGIPSIYVNADRYAATRSVGCIREVLSVMPMQPYFYNLFLSDFDKYKPVVFVDGFAVKAANTPYQPPKDGTLEALYEKLAVKLPEANRRNVNGLSHEQFPALNDRIQNGYLFLYRSSSGLRLYVRKDRFKQAREVLPLAGQSAPE